MNPVDAAKAPLATKDRQEKNSAVAGVRSALSLPIGTSTTNYSSPRVGVSLNSEKFVEVYGNSVNNRLPAQAPSL
jgi:hypothetical protein